jgi:hypothetical protein
MFTAVKWCSLTKAPSKPRLLANRPLVEVIAIGLSDGARIAEAIGEANFGADFGRHVGIGQFVEGVELHAPSLQRDLRIGSLAQRAFGGKRNTARPITRGVSFRGQLPR